MNTWTKHVENFGKIKSADIEAAPLILAARDNNSSKSYIMTLIYKLNNADFNMMDISLMSNQKIM